MSSDSLKNHLITFDSFKVSAHFICRIFMLRESKTFIQAVAIIFNIGHLVFG